jgi:hypothetical protein
MCFFSFSYQSPTHRDYYNKDMICIYIKREFTYKTGSGKCGMIIW